MPENTTGLRCQTSESFTHFRVRWKKDGRWKYRLRAAARVSDGLGIECSDHRAEWQAAATAIQFSPLPLEAFQNKKDWGICPVLANSIIMIDVNKNHNKVVEQPLQVEKTLGWVNQKYQQKLRGGNGRRGHDPHADLLLISGYGGMSLTLEECSALQEETVQASYPEI